MAQLVLSAASSAASAFSGVGAALARTAATTIAGFAASQVDRLIFGPQKRKRIGPRLDSFQLQASTEGAPVLRVFGRARIAGQLIWAANFKEAISETIENSGGKGGRPAVQTETTQYLYSISFAIGLCEGEIDRVARVWADGKPFDLSDKNFRLYRGGEHQNADGLIEAIEGAGDAPGFRGLAYIVFEDLPLKEFGNRIPQLSFEVEKGLAGAADDVLEKALTAVTIIPGSGEFVYGTTKVTRQEGEGVSVSENAHNNTGKTNFTASLEALKNTAPNLSAASLVVSWFANSTDAGACRLEPAAETRDKTTTPYDWRAGGVSRGEAKLVSRRDGAPAFGGTPADRGVIEAIIAMKARGLHVLFHPFILVDAPGFPWRGRINVGARDQSQAASSAIAQFFGAARPSDFSIANGDVVYQGPDEWSFRRMILHNAYLCAAAGGVEAFILGSEMRGVTTARDGAGNYPGVVALISMVKDVRAVLGPATKLSYGADWSEYFGHQLGGGDIDFHMDDFWADQDVDFIGIDNYLSLADWRDGFSHKDFTDGASSIYDRDYLARNITGGENHDWFYASQADRAAQIRQPIADGAYGENWIYRPKDFRGWWGNAHHHRRGGVRQAAPTKWVPKSKPLRFTELGCPAVDKGANQPNVFVDAKSSESALPYFSSGARDDLMQRRFLEAHLAHWNNPANNPISSSYNGAMVTRHKIYIYAHDARPFPFFPARRDLWGDGDNWEKGHWLNGRLGRAPLDLLVTALADEAGFKALDTRQLKGVLSGYVVDRPLSPREMIDPLADVFQFDMVEAGDEIRFQPRDAGPSLILGEADLVRDKQGRFKISFAQAHDLPSAFRLGFFDEGADYAPSVAEARHPAGHDVREEGVEIAAILPQSEAEARARSILADASVMGERAGFSLPPSRLEVEPGDVLFVQTGAPTMGGARELVSRRYRVTEIADGQARQIESVRTAPAVYDAPQGTSSFKIPPTPPQFGAALWELFETPLLREGDDPARPWFGAFADPWPGSVALYRDSDNGVAVFAGGAVFAGAAGARAVMGVLKSSAPAAYSGRWDRREIRVNLSFGTLSSREELDVLAGANAAAIKSRTGAYEILQFANAQLASNGDWVLSNLLRGQKGSEEEALAGADIGARFILLSPALTQTGLSATPRGVSFSWRAGPGSNLPSAENFTAKNLTLTNRGLQPLSPVHLRGRRQGEDLAFSWIRRTRIGGDDWAGEDVPLGETFELYRVRVLAGGQELRVHEVSAPQWVYTGAEMTADISRAPPGETISLVVAQISDLVGPGREARIVIER